MITNDIKLAKLIIIIFVEHQHNHFIRKPFPLLQLILITDKIVLK